MQVVLHFKECSTYQHGCSQVEFMEELSDENMHFKYIGNVFSFNVSEDVNEPLKIAVGGTNPQKVDFFAGNPRVTIGGGTEDQIVEDWGVGGHADTPTHHNCNLELVPVLVASTEGSFNADLGWVVFVLLLVVDGLVKAVRQNM